MSGGSYNYICFKTDIEELVPHLSDLENMADRLESLDAEDAAKETLELKAIIRQSQIRVEVLAQRMSALWRAVEWMDSGDSGMKEVEAQLKRYRGEA